MDRTAKERDFYLRLIELASATDLGSLLADALALVTAAAGAARGYLEVCDVDGDPLWATAHGFDASQQEAIRNAISTGIIAQALATGRVVQTTSAVLDPRFNARASVMRNQIEGVLCAPFHADPLTGAVYLEAQPGAPRFDAADVALVELLARHLAPVANRLVARRRTAEDPTQVWRSRLKCEGVVGHSRALARLLAEVAGAAPLDVTALLAGPSGAGKNVVARLLHANGPRSDGPFVELNCANLEHLVESELFGVVPGAYTDAVRRKGKVEAARGGTLFLDEIAELPLTSQAKLLQLIDQRVYYKVGDDTPQSADVRLVAATNADLGEAVAARRFREDLYYRLKVLTFDVPPLAQRTEDIEPLTVHFAAEAARRHRFAVPHLTPGAVEALQFAEWPGNIRQLANTVESAVVRAQRDGGRFLEARHLFPDRASAPDDDDDPSFHAATRRFQRQYLVATLTECRWNISEGARRLGLARSHLYTLLNEHGLRRD